MEPTERALPADLHGSDKTAVIEEERDIARAALSHGEPGAILIAGIAVALLFIGWLLFYFVLFMRRGYVG